MFPKPVLWCLAAVAVLTIFLIWLTDAAGIGATPDTANYLAAARAFADRGDLTILGGKPLVWWPPLYPATWGVLLALGLEGFTAAWALNILSFVAFAWAWALIFEKGLCPTPSAKPSPSWWLPWLLMLASYGNLHLFANATSEPGFLALSAWSIWCLTRFDRNRRLSSLLPAAMLAGAACLWRYPGVGFVLAGALFLWTRAGTWSKRIKTIAIWLATGLAPLLVWFIRNWMVAGTLTGARNLPPYGWWTNLKASTFAALRWLFNGPQWSRETTLAVAGLLVCGLVLLRVIGKAMGAKAIGSETPPQKTGARIRALLIEPGRSIELLLLFYIVIYAASSWLLASISFTSYPNARLVSPLMAPLFFLIAKYVTALIERSHRLSGRKPLVWMLGFAALIYLAIGMWEIGEERQRGWGIHNVAWQRSPLLLAIENLPEDAVIFTNFRTELYLNTGKDRPGLPPALADLTRLRQRHWPQGAYLAWSTLPKGRRKAYDVPTMIQTLQPESVATFDDGWLIRLRPSPQP